MDTENLVKVLKNGGVAVMPTDTIYGLVGQALNPETVARIYKIKKRSPEKQCIALIGSLDELRKFNLSISAEQKKQIENFKEPTSFIVGENSFRLPKEDELRTLLLQTGPLIAPSANPEGLPPAQNIKEAREYFGNNVDLYVDGGTISGKASKLIELHSDGSVTILRE